VDPEFAVEESSPQVARYFVSIKLVADRGQSTVRKKNWGGDTARTLESSCSSTWQNPPHCEVISQ